MGWSSTISCLGPAFLVYVGSLDPGKWATALEGGSRFGLELVWVMVGACAFAAILQSLSSRLGLVTGRNLAQICSDEYPRYLSVLLWLQCQVSILIMDLTTVLGIAMALNALLGVTMITGMLLTVADTLLFLMVFPHLGLYKAEVLTASIMAVVLFCFSVEAFHSNAALAPAFFQGLIPRLKGEMLYIAAGILGANVLPPNFYLHSALVLDDKGTKGYEHSILLHHSIVDIATGSGVILLVNLAILTSAAAMFHNSGHVVITLQDAQALLEQVLSSSGAPAAFGFALLCAEQLSSRSLAISGQVATEGFLRLKLSLSFHRVFTRMGAALAGMCLVRSLGSEGTFQVLIFLQLLLALQLPFAVVPLLKVTSSEAVMGRFKNSPFVESISWICIGLIYVMNIWVAYDMLFGTSDEYVGSGSWNLMRDLIDSSMRWREALRVLCLISVMGVMTASTLFLSSMISAPVKEAECSIPSYIGGPSVSRLLEGSHTKDLQEGVESKSPASVHVSKAFLPQDLGTGYHRTDAEYEEAARVGAEYRGTARIEAKYGEAARVDPDYHEAARISESPLTTELISEPLLQDADILPARVSESPLTRELFSESLLREVDIPDIKVLEGQCEIFEAHHQQQVSKDVSQMNEPSMSLAAQDSQGKLADNNLDTWKQAQTAASGDGPSYVESSSVNSSSKERVVSHPESATEINVQIQSEAKFTKDDAAERVKAVVEDVDLELLDKDDYDLDGWETLDQDDALQDSLSVLGGSVSSLTLEEPVSGRSFSARSDASEGSCGGSGSGSLSRLSGLGRAARRQFAALLDEFWSKLYDLHGQPVSQVQEKARGESGKAAQPDKPLAYKEAFGVNSTWYTSKLAQKSWQKNVKADTGGNDSYLHPTYYGPDPSYGGNNPCSHKNSPHDSNERRYLSLRYPSFRDNLDNQPATIHGYKMASYAGRSGGFSTGMDTSSYLLERQRQLMQQASGEQALLAGSLYRLSTSTCSGLESSFPSNSAQSYFSPLYGKLSSGRPLDNFSLANKLSAAQTDRAGSYAKSQYNPYIGQDISAWDPLVYRAAGELDIPKYDQLSMQREQASLSASFPRQPIGERGNLDMMTSHNGKTPPLCFDEISPSQSHKEAFSIQSASQNQSLWATQPFELFGSARMPIGSGRASSHMAINQALGPNGNHIMGTSSPMDIAGHDHDIEILNSLRSCIRKLLKLDGSDWLFRLDSGSDEDLIGAVAAREKVLVDADTRRDLQTFHTSSEQLWPPGFQKLATSSSELVSFTLAATGVPHCGEGCVWSKELLISFGVWCIHRVLELALMESRPELWGKYTYVLNRLQGVLDPAFSRIRTVLRSCICLLSEVPDGQGRGLSKQVSPLNDGGMGEPLSRTLSGGFVGNSFQGYPQSWPWGRNSSTGKGKGASSLVFLEIIKDVETAIGARKGRTGTAAGDVAFPKGKENLASVLKRYKRRLGNKGSGPVANGSGPNSGKRRAPLSSPSVFG